MESMVSTLPFVLQKYAFFVKKIQIRYFVFIILTSLTFREQMSIKGMQVSLKGVQLLQGGAVVSTAPTKLTIHSVRLVHFLLGWCT